MSKKKAYKFFGTLGDIIGSYKKSATYSKSGILKDWNEFIISSVSERFFRENFIIS